MDHAKSICGAQSISLGIIPIENRKWPHDYLSGDTAYFDGFEQLGKEFDIDLAVFNLGAYEPRWFMAPSHMNPRETVQAFKELKAKRLMVVHWGTFRLGDEPVHFPPMHIKQELKKEGMLDRLVDLKPGQTYFFDSSSWPKKSSH